MLRDLPRAHAATESRDFEATLERVPDLEAFVQRLQGRVRPFMDLRPGARVLDVGAAQGATALAYRRAGFDAYGVEPWEPAIETGRQIAERTGMPFEIRRGVGEALPFEDEFFDFVHAYSVMEHVDDPQQVFREVFRVLRPGGGFYFMTGGVIRPWQHEIKGFPLFPWYPDRAKRAIMAWAARERPSLVGHTTRPAIHWFKHQDVRRELVAIGFRRLVDKWEFRAASGERSGVAQLLLVAATRNRAVRFAGEFVIGSVEYLAIK